MALLTLKEVLKESVSERYAVGAFDVFEHLFAEGVIQAAEEKCSPVIIMVTEDLFADPSSVHFFAYLVDRIRRSPCPMALHLDHATKFESIMLAIHHGFTSVMFDASEHPFEENAALTKKVVEVAHSCGVSVEGEVGHVGGGEGNLDGGLDVNQNHYTTPEEAKKFVEETGVDALAVAIGTIHGLYKGAPDINYGLAEQIRSQVDVPLVLHGGSGLSNDDFKSCVKYGINKVNIFTGMSLAAVDTMHKVIEKNPGSIHFPHVMFAAKQTVTKIAGDYIDVFGTKSI